MVVLFSVVVESAVWRLSIGWFVYRHKNNSHRLSLLERVCDHHSLSGLLWMVCVTSGLFWWFVCYDMISGEYGDAIGGVVCSLFVLLLFSCHVVLHKRNNNNTHPETRDMNNIVVIQ